MGATATHTGKRRHADHALAALLVQPTIAAAAESAGVSETTLMRWMQEPQFAGRYREARAQLVVQTGAALQRASSGAVATLQAVMEDSEAPASARVSAARAVLELALRAREQEELSARIEALEAAVAEQEQRQNEQPHWRVP
jgi:DNA-binding MurR/RpiR family transcriptional regulator